MIPVKAFPGEFGSSQSDVLCNRLLTKDRSGCWNDVAGKGSSRLHAGPVEPEKGLPRYKLFRELNVCEIRCN